MTDVPRSDKSGRSDDVGGDDALLDELRVLEQGLDPTPEHVRLAAKESLAARSPIGTELAELSHDSALDEQPVAGLEPGVRVLRFEARQLTIEIEVSDAAGSLRIAGQLTPPHPARVDCRHARGIVESEADAHGRFALEGVHAGAVSLRFRLDRDKTVTVQTDWVTLSLRENSGGAAPRI